ncbi:hypothetical protein PIROE2DRAFT_12043 [Piromyces sp. E2]|nr:hypothetical protein PIROE2DRAFT_12043 [Piromyces sp. E2]|eukprot:OUM61840.1 hypothetical protein PIROE2DRAFT_12043 [Piromyces sp. E2]
MVLLIIKEIGGKKVHEIIKPFLPHHDFPTPVKNKVVKNNVELKGEFEKEKGKNDRDLYIKKRMKEKDI